MILFIGLEVLSLALYVLSAIITTRRRSQEAGMKYFILSSFASAFLLYGMALTYGATGSTNLTAIRAFLSSHRDSPLGSGLWAAVAGGAGTDGGRLLLQGIGDPVPGMDAGCLRRRADLGDGVHVGRHQGRGVRRDWRGSSSSRSRRSGQSGSRSSGPSPY